MDYLDPKKQVRHRIILLVGYCVIAVAIVITTMILLYQAYGFGLGQNGSVIQNGLVFISSQPVSAQISINGVKKSQTSSRLVLPSGIYKFDLSRTGYRDWQRTIEVLGGSVNRYDYPLLIPKVLKPAVIQDFTAAPLLTSQSPDRRWLLIQKLNTASFDLIDLKNATKPSLPLIVPVATYSKVVSTESWQALEWADDNLHLLMLHNFDGKSEYLLIDRQNVEQTVNLTTALTLGNTQLTLRNKKYDQYYSYEITTASLKSMTLNSPTQASVVERALAYKSIGSDTVLYITDTEAPAGKVLLKMLVGSQTYTLRSFPISAMYMVDIANYSGNLYVTASIVSDGKVYIYKDPIGQLKALPNHVVVPMQVMHISDPNFVSFSSVTQQFIMAENGNQFAVYDLENRNGYKYAITSPIDAPQTKASWLDGSHLAIVSSGKLLIFDFDKANQQATVSASSSYTPFLSTDFKTMFYFDSVNQAMSLNQVSFVAN